MGIKIFTPSAQPVVLELAVPKPTVSIFERDEVFGESQCREIMQVAVTSNYSLTCLMQLAACLHQIKQTSDATELYQYIRIQYSDYAFVLVNMAILELMNGDPRKAIMLLDIYFQEVGGVFGELSSMKDGSARIHGPTCSPMAIDYKSDCVYALNVYASAHMQMLNNSFAENFFKRALELADEGDSSLQNIYSNLGDLLGNLGDDEGASNSYLKSFWKSAQEGRINAVRLGLQYSYNIGLLTSYFTNN